MTGELVEAAKLIKRMLIKDREYRVSATVALKHKWFKVSLFPTTLILLVRKYEIVLIIVDS
jgi:serine/threonine protein kinase